MFDWIKRLFSPKAAPGAAPAAADPPLSIAEAAARMDEAGVLTRLVGADPDYAKAEFAEIYGRAPPGPLAAFYDERIESLGSYQAEYPTQEAYERRNGGVLRYWVEKHIGNGFAPVFTDGLSNYFAVDLEGAGGAAPGGVYFFNHEKDDEGRPSYAVATSLAKLILVLGGMEQLGDELEAAEGEPTPLLDSLDLHGFDDPRARYLRSIDPGVEGMRLAKPMW